MLVKSGGLLTLDLRFFFVDKSFLGVRSPSQPVGCCCSADGKTVIAGSEDGRVLAWHAGEKLRHAPVFIQLEMNDLAAKTFP